MRRALTRWCPVALERLDDLEFRPEGGIAGTVTCNDQDIRDEARRISAQYRAPDEVDDAGTRWKTASRVRMTVTPELGARHTRRSAAPCGTRRRRTGWDDLACG